MEFTIYIAEEWSSSEHKTHFLPTKCDT